MPPSNCRRVRVYYYSSWGGKVQEAGDYLAAQPTRDLSPGVARPGDPELLRLARLDRDGDAQNLRAFAAMQHSNITFLPIRIVGSWGLFDLYNLPPPLNEEPWLVFIASRPGNLANEIGRLLGMVRSKGFRIFYWAYDEASRTMPCFASGVAPYLSVLIHDETPLAPEVAQALDPSCIVIHRSWVANVIPFEYPIAEEADRKIVFLGSKVGMNGHRTKQIGFLQSRFKDAFVSMTDHTVGMDERGRFSQYRVYFCPEGQHFATFGMRQTHTDRPFWTGCLGEVPVVEDSKWGGRLEDLYQGGLICRYPHGDLHHLAQACEAALECQFSQRLRIYEHFNTSEVIGVVAAQAIAGSK